MRSSQTTASPPVQGRFGFSCATTVAPAAMKAGLWPTTGPRLRRPAPSGGVTWISSTSGRSAARRE